ncbi:hypothetical protein GCM10008956_14090 [Deinococcus arenae]|uniref:HMA domain-containing protein n=2 Tax=Deinococcaceae TaxID=183710 RepID=A0A8H9GMD6_9DEIO|nr:hypothetical protein GCM10008956_14090 [Deinococcus arenae]
MARLPGDLLNAKRCDLEAIPPGVEERPAEPACNPPPGGLALGMTTELTITGMTCGHCEKAVRDALQGVPGVQGVQVDRAAGQATVTGDADLQALIRAVTEEGYAAQARA